MILKFKNGSGIHIKKSHRGLFTKYCNGKVTSECIAKGKRSPDPKIRKRATFAANVRKFKHQNGGKMYYKSSNKFYVSKNQEGGILFSLKDEVEQENEDNKRKAKGLFKGIVNGSILPTLPNLGTMIGKAYKGWVGPRTVEQTGVPPLPIIQNKAKVVELLKNPIKGEILNGAKSGFKDVYDYYNSEKYIKHLINTGLTRKEALELQKLKLDNIINTHLNFDYYEPNTYGRFITNTEGKRIVQLNPELSNTESLAREGVWHELGGHASIRAYREGLDKKYPQFFDSSWYKRISDHTKEIMPELRPQWKAFLKGDMETFNKLASKQDLDFVATHKNVNDFIKYINDEQETVARAMASNIGDYAGLPSKWNLDQLKIFFTDNGIESLRRNVWNIAGPGILFGQFDFLPLKKENK